MTGPIFVDPDDRPTWDDVIIPPDRECPVCSGYGFIIDSTANERKCPHCNGSGQK